MEMQNEREFKNIVRSKTGIIFDERMMNEHKCLWDENYPERPERLTRIVERCNELQLIERCQRIPSRKATKEEILTKHTEGQYENLKSASQLTNLEELEKLSSKSEAVYFHPSTFELSLLACGSAIDLVKNVVEGNVQNGMAIIRPPGHHAMKNEFNGFCFFNNVAVAAQNALDNLNLKRILIVDWDVHHGQGTQRLFYDDPRVLYFSIHRYEFGKYWPKLKESNYDHIGTGQGTGFNFNVPLNKTAMKNGDYLAIFNQILVPVAVEFQPELIIVSAGYDSALGCPIGQMEITPAFYAHLLNPLLCLSKSKIAVILEGGYCLSSLSEGATLTLRALLGDPCPLIEKLDPPCQLIQDAIINCINAHRPYWKCLQILSNCKLNENKILIDESNPKPSKYPTRSFYDVLKEDVRIALEQRLAQLKQGTNLSFPKERLSYVCDNMMLGTNKRTEAIINKFNEYELFQRMQELACRYASDDELCLAHTEAYVKTIKERVVKDEDLIIFENSFNYEFLQTKTFEFAKFATGSALQVVDSVLSDNSRSGLCIIRPPKQQTTIDYPHFSSIFNNVAIAAQYAIDIHGLKRVLILDWDVYHDKSTQQLFESNSKILYISVHRYDNGNFFPKSTEANYTEIGHGSGTGFNVNIPWNKDGMGDFEYSLVFQNIIMPIAYEFDPQLVIVSAGFGAIINNPLGGCNVTPQAYACFTHWLSALANGKIILCQDSGKNGNEIADAMVMCTKVLLGDPIPIMKIDLETSEKLISCYETIRNVQRVHEKYWNRLKFNK